MSLDKSRIPKRGNSSRKFIPEKQRKTMTDPFVDWIKRTRSDKEGTVSGRMVETRSQKTSEERRELLEVEVNTDHTMNDNQGVNGLEGRGRRLASESTPVEQGHDFATSTGTLDREEMSELSDISTEVTATRRSPTDNTMMAGGTGKQTTSSSFSERMKNTFGNIFPFSMGGGAGNDGESQEEEDEEEQGDFGSQVSLHSSIHESEAHVGRETGTMDKFGVVTTISKEANTPGQSKDFAIRTSSEPQPEESRTRGPGNALADPEMDNEKTSRQRVKARISTSTKLPGTDRVTPPLVTPLMDNGAALEEALNNIVGSLGEQNEQMSIRMSELERAVHIERESLREEINRNRQEVDRSEKRLKERTDEHMTRNLSRMTREAEQRELRLRADMEKLRIQQEQSLGSLDTKIDAMMERRTQAIMDRLDGLLSSKSGPKEGEPNSGGPSREPRVNFNEHQRRKTYGSTRGRGSSSGYATRGNTAWGPNSRASSTGNRQTSNERPTQSTHATGRSDSGNMINTWIARHGCPMTFQSDNGTAFVGELTKELMRRSQVAQAHSTTYHPQTNGLVERQNRTLVSMLRVYCSRYMTDWDRYLPQVMGAYNSTQHSTTGVSPHMMLTGHEKSLPLTFFYPEYEGKKTSPQVYVRDVIRRQQELNDLCRRNTQQAQARQRKRFDKKAAGAKAYSVGDYVWVFQNVIPPKGTKKLLKKWRGPFMITEVHQEGRFYRLSTGRAAHYENIKPHNPSTEDWCIPADMEEGDYLMMDPACEINEKGTREKNDGNEVVEEGTDTPLDLDPNEQIEADDETLPYAEEDWQDSEQTEIPKNMEPDLPFTMQTRQKDGMRPRKKYNPYGDDFVVDRIDLKKIVEEVVGLEEITVSQDIDIVDDHNDEWVDDWSKPEVEFDDEQQQSNEQDLTNLRVLEWLNEMTSDPEKTSVTIQDVDRESAKYIKTERDDPSWAAQEGQLLIPASNLDLIPGMRSTGTPMDIFVRGVGVGLTHTENLIIKKLRIARETGNLEPETGEEPKKPDIGRVVESYFNLPNEYSSNIILTDSDFILTNRTCAVAITADMSFRTALAADFKREYKNVEFLWKQRPGIGGVAALPPAVSQIPGKYLCFLVTRATEKQHVDPENLVLSLTRLRDFLVEMDVKELSLPVYDPNRGRLHPRELYALVHVIFSDTNIQVYLHKKYYLSIG